MAWCGLAKAAKYTYCFSIRFLLLRIGLPIALTLSKVHLLLFDPIPTIMGFDDSTKKITLNCVVK